MLTSFEKTIDNSTHRYEYSYDKDGFRTVKKYFEDGILQTETVYMWKDGKLVGSNVSDDSGSTIFTIKYIYNGEELVAINLNGSVLLVEKNLQGDITSLYSVDNNEKLFDFYYDAYGNVSFSQENSIIVTIIKALVVVLASVAYRGYYYDFDTGLYYLQSRYYDPQTGRFISLDDTQFAISTAGTPLGSNLYAYCYNNPVNASDPTGEYPGHSDRIQSLGISIVNGIGLTEKTQNGTSWLVNNFGFFMDSKGYYHTKIICWQRLFGFNDLYDFVFNIVTKMEREKFEYSYGGVRYIIWTWKGYYFNLGAGAEVGSYIKSVIPYHWSALVPWIELQMKLYLYYSEHMCTEPNKEDDSLLIGSYIPGPDEPQWWITVFNPQYQDDIRPEHLHLKCEIKFDALRFAAFKYAVLHGEHSKDYKPYWTFYIASHTAILRF